MESPFQSAYLWLGAWWEKLSDMEWNCFLMVPWPLTSVFDYSSFRNSKQGWVPQYRYTYQYSTLIRRQRKLAEWFIEQIPKCYLEVCKKSCSKGNNHLEHGFLFPRNDNSLLNSDNSYSSICDDWISCWWKDSNVMKKVNASLYVTCSLLFFPYGNSSSYKRALRISPKRYFFLGSTTHRYVCKDIFISPFDLISFCAVRLLIILCRTNASPR